MRSILLIASTFLIISCQKETEPFLPSEKFISIFENPSEGMNYDPIDLIQTEDDGFLILAKSNNNQVFVLKANERGEFIWSGTMSSAYINPIGNFIQNQGRYYFVTSALTDGTAVLVEVDDLEQRIEPIRNYTGFRRPLAFDYLNPDNYLMLTNNDTIGAVLSKIQNGFAMEWARAYDTMQNANAKLNAYLETNNPQFFVGAYNNGAILYFNALRPEGMILTYADEQGIETGRISSSAQGEINSIFTYDNATGAFNYTIGKQSYFVNEAPLSNKDTARLIQLQGEPMPDRMQNRNTLSLSIQLSAATYLVNAFTTVDGRVKLSFYEQNSGALSAIEYIGGNDPIEVIRIIATEDQGLVLLTKTTLAGVKQRIKLLKIPKEEIMNML